jgi:hypothetical protein
LQKKFLFFIFISLLSNLSFAAETILEVIPLFNRPASEIQPLLSPLLESTDQVIADGSNLIVRTTHERLAEIKIIISKLDARQNNLIITVIQSRQTTAEELNAAARVRLNIPVDDVSKSGGRINGHVYQTQDQHANENTQTIRTMEGNPAYIKTGSTYPTQNVQIYNSGYGYPAVSTSTEFIEATTGFAVTPRLAGQQVILDVSPWSDKMNKRGQIQTQDAQSTIRMNLGEWVELGGIGENSNSSTTGNLSTIRQTSRNQLHILVKVDQVD